VGQRMVKLLAGRGHGVKDARVGILGVTFKENVPDLRNSKVPGIVTELQDFHVTVLVHDAMADPAEAQHEFGISLAQLEEFRNLDGLVIAVAHNAYRSLPLAELTGMEKPGGVIVDVK